MRHELAPDKDEKKFNCKGGHNSTRDCGGKEIGSSGQEPKVAKQPYIVILDRRAGIQGSVHAQRWMVTAALGAGKKTLIVVIGTIVVMI